MNHESSSASVPSWRITLSDLDWDTEEEEAALRVIRSRWVTMGAETHAFEEEFAAALGARHAIAVANGTAALHLAALALGLGAGADVAQPAVNFVAAANVTALIGARPVFGDIQSLADPTLDPRDLEARLTPTTRAVVVMHYGGAGCAMDEIVALARRRGLAVIEDACHGVGAWYRGKALGTLGDIGCFSFFSNKNLAIGEGGMLTTGDNALAARLRELRSHGMTTLTWDRHRGHASTYDVTAHGFNYRIDEIRAAIGRVQLRKLAAGNARRRALAREYRRLVKEEFSSLLKSGWIFPELGAAGDEASHHLFVAVAPDAVSRQHAADRLRAAGIQTSLHYPFIPAFSAFARTLGESGPTAEADLPRASQFCRRVLTLPLHPRLLPGDVRLVLAALAAQS